MRFERGDGVEVLIGVKKRNQVVKSRGHRVVRLQFPDAGDHVVCVPLKGGEDVHEIRLKLGDKSLAHELRHCLSQPVLGIVCRRRSGQ